MTPLIMFIPFNYCWGSSFALIGNMPWNLSMFNFPFKLISRQWKVLTLPQSNIQTQEL
jgi:hypothetical protein